ncbi:MAG: DPP IV N-terminal domain-containing protein [Flavobacteriales bacterium]|nr:DPP IV N-terminal domain-containing protein [Flavobacteriales bacterium]MDG1780936.1 DPP IV N-terminal domain-containing protein [Flavobacteriales bacterium]MDG2245964.1 DPP IV N-terminal domain-containing protein [Flavobacteriales bacterium]
MKQLFFLLAIISIGFSTSAQKISINDAVMLQRSDLGPDRLSQVQWLKKKDAWSHVEDNTLKVLSTQNKELQSVSLETIQNALDKEIKRFPRITWLSEQVCYFVHQKQYYKLNVITNEVTKWVTRPVGENIEFHEGSGHFAFTQSNNVVVSTGEREFRVTSLEDGITAGQAIARYEFGIGKGLFWSPDGSSLAFYQKDERGVSSYPLVDYATTPASVNMIKYPMAGATGENASAGIFTIKTGKTIYLNVPFDGPADGFYITNLSWSPNGSSVYAAIVARDQKSMQLVQFNAETGEVQKIVLTETSEKYVEPEQPVKFIPGKASEFLWFSEKDGYNNIYRYSTGGKLLGKTTATFPISDIVGFDAKSKFMVVHAHGANPTEKHAYKVELSSMKMTKITKSAGYHRVKLSPSARFVLDTWSSLEVPNKVEILSISGKGGAMVHNSKNPLKGREIGETSIFSIKGENDMDLWCRMITPPNMEKGEKYPVLVYVYNGPHVQLVTNSWLGGAPLWMHSMAAEGYIIFTLDGRGSSHRGIDFEQAIHRQVGTKEIQDQKTGAEYLKTLPYVDADRMAVHGWSYGGFMTTSLMLREPGLFKVGVAGGPVIDWNYYEIMYTERYMDTPQDNPKGYENANLKKYVSNLEGDLLMIHGTVDDVVVMQHNMSFQKACVDEGVQVDFYPYPGHPHNVRGKDRVHLMTKVLDYVKANL